MVPAPVRIGLAGYGLGGRYFHAPLIASAADCEFLGVVTTSPERRRQVAEDLGRPAFASVEELAGAGAEAVAISTPVPTHVTLTQQVLRLGLAVVRDKPFVPDADSARRVVRLSEQLNVPLTVHQNRRWDSDFPDRARAPGQRIARRADRLRAAVRAVPAGARPARAGGGTLLDFGSHLARPVKQVRPLRASHVRRGQPQPAAARWPGPPWIRMPCPPRRPGRAAAW